LCLRIYGLISAVIIIGKLSDAKKVSSF
jgi:hypothetical protein